LYGSSTDDVESRFRLIGGIPRFVFEKFDDLDETIQSAIGRLSIEKFKLIAEGRLQKEDEISHLIIHFLVKENYKFVSLQFASGLLISFSIMFSISNVLIRVRSGAGTGNLHLAGTKQVTHVPPCL